MSKKPSKKKMNEEVTLNKQIKGLALKIDALQTEINQPNDLTPKKKKLAEDQLLTLRMEHADLIKIEKEILMLKNENSELKNGCFSFTTLNILINIFF
jgi:hypothetical protein